MPVADTVSTSPAWRPLDLTIFGILFLLSAPVELGSIIRTEWEYPVKFFGVVTEGTVKLLLLWAQPLLHLAIGYGFLKRRAWAWYVALFYAADTLTSSVVWFVIEGYGTVRTVFLVLLTPFVVYLIVRRRYFVQ
jgi:hypothetical protein